MKFSLLRSWDPDIREVAAGASVALVARLAGAGASFGLAVAVAWLLGAAQAGRFFLAVTVVTIGSVVGRSGLENTVLRFAAAAADDENWGRVGGLYRRGTTIAVTASLAVTLALGFGGRRLAGTVFDDPALAPALLGISVALIPISVFTLYGQLLKGIKRTGEGVVVLSGLLPSLSLVLIVVLAPRWGLAGAITAYVAAAVTTALIAAALWTRAVPSRAGGFPTSELVRSSLPLFVHNCLQMVIKHCTILVLGMFVTNADVGVFGVAFRTAFLMSYVLIAVDSIAAPKFSALYSRGDIETLKRTAQGSTFLMCMIAGPLLALFVLFPEQVMRIYSDEFTRGASLLAVLAVGQFVNVATGSVEMLLMMCGREKWVMGTTTVTAGLAVALNWVLIRRWGVMGGAVATAIVLAAQNIMVLLTVRYLLGFWVVPAPRFRGR